MAVVSTAFVIAAIVNSQPKPPEVVQPFKVKTLDDAAPDILKRNSAQQVKSLEQTNAAAKEALAQSDNAAIRKIATKHLLDALKAINSGDKECLRSEIGLDCWLNIQEGLWADRLEQASLVMDGGQMLAASAQ
jgi:hypothetical protein